MLTHAQSKAQAHRGCLKSRPISRYDVKGSRKHVFHVVSVHVNVFAVCEIKPERLSF